MLADRLGVPDGTISNVSNRDRGGRRFAGSVSPSSASGQLNSTGTRGFAVSATLTGESVCTRVARRLEQTVGAHRFRIWFGRGAQLSHDEGQGRLRLSLPNRFVAEGIERQFGVQLRDMVAHELGASATLELCVESQRSPAVTPSTPPSAASANPPAAAPGREPHVASLRHSLDDFIVGACNQMAYAAAVQLAQATPAAPSPLFIHGGCGLGKTHLLQGVCRRLLQRRPDARVLYLTGEQFTNDFLAAIRTNSLERFRAKVRRLDLLAIDDVHFLADKEKTQQEFLHSFDAIDLSGSRLVLASDSHPRLIRQFSEALVSRCVRGMVVEVTPPDTAMRVRIVQALAAKRNLSLVQTVVQMLAARTAGSVREIEGVLTKLHALATLTDQAARPSGQSPVEVGCTLLHQLDAAERSIAPRKPVTPQAIFDALERRLQLSRGQIVGPTRTAYVVLGRDLFVHVARLTTMMSYPEIARLLARRSHSSVVAAAQRFEKRLARADSVRLPQGDITLPDLVAQLRRDVAV